MDQTESAQSSARPANPWDRLLRSASITLGEPQRRRLEWLARRYGECVVWDPHRAPPSHGVIIVVEPPTGPGAELLYRALHPGCVVVIPFGENPVFDFLKSKLKDFGTIGASGAEGPHEFWWGGADWSGILHGLERSQAKPTVGYAGRGWTPVGVKKARQNDPSARRRGSTPDDGATAATRPPLIVSCYPRRADGIDITRLTRSLEALGLDFVVEAIDTAASGRMSGSEKAGFIRDLWVRQDRPILWIEPDAAVVNSPSLFNTIGCDFAVHKWNRWELSPRTLYFGRSGAAEALLHTWHRLALCHPTIWEGYLLDQAWSTVSSQLPLDTVWLPRSYHAPSTDQSGHKTPVIIHHFPSTTSNLGPDPQIAATLRAARRASRIGAPESLLVMRSKEGSGQAVTVILRDVQGAVARAVAADVEAIARAFARDCGGHSQLELSLCHWQEDVTAAISAATFGQNRILEIAACSDPSENMFQRPSPADNDRPGRNVVPLNARGASDAIAQPPLPSNLTPTVS